MTCADSQEKNVDNVITTVHSNLLNILDQPILFFNQHYKRQIVTVFLAVIHTCLVFKLNACDLTESVTVT